MKQRRWPVPVKTEETETEFAEENVMLEVGVSYIRFLLAGTLRALRYCASDHASGSRSPCYARDLRRLRPASAVLVE